MAILKPPLAPKKPHTTITHSFNLEDPWFWLKDPNYPDVKDKAILDYLNKENAYYQVHLDPLEPLKDKIYNELKGRLKQDDEGVPFKDGAYVYQWKFNKGAEYRHWLRWQGDKTPQKILDEASRAENKDFFNLRSFDISPNDKFLAWSEDGDGSERFNILVKNIKEDKTLKDTTSNTSGAVIWDESNNGYFYIELNENHRPFRLKFHKIGTPVEQDSLLIEEGDDGFYMGISKTQSRKYLTVNIGDHITSEVHIINLSTFDYTPTLVSKRRERHEYSLDHAEGCFFIRSNKFHKDFSIFKTTETSLGEESWERFYGSGKTYIRGFQTFKKWIVIEDRVDGLDQIYLSNHSGEEGQKIIFNEAAYTVGIGQTPDYNPPSIRLNYASMTTPPSIFDYNLNTQKLTLKKEQEIPSGYNKHDYITERLMAPVRDGTLVPISIVHHKDFKIDGSGPLHLYGYGAYGLGIPPSFSIARLSLLDRGFAYAIAHIRGGDELGHSWYEGGKLKTRTNTFHDFVDCAKYLSDEKYTNLGNISCSGGSAGGSLMGYVLNSNPEIWKVMVAHVPFVDILTTMLDITLPLTPMEWPEWGNPIEDKEAYKYIKSYCPYNNVEAKSYPPLMVTAGLNDPRVTYWEPAKWVAKLRDKKTDTNPLIFKTNMGAGHQGKSGRYEGLTEIAEEYAFILSTFGLTS